MRKTLLVVVAFLLGAALSAGGAVAIHGKSAQSHLGLIETLTVAQAANEFQVSYLWGDYRAAECKFERYRQLVAGTIDQKSPAERDLLLTRLGIAFARLALSAERSGLEAERDRAFRAAQATFASSGERPTIEKLRQLVISADASWQRSATTCE